MDLIQNYKKISDFFKSLKTNKNIFQKTKKLARSNWPYLPTTALVNTFFIPRTAAKETLPYLARDSVAAENILI